MRSTRGLARAVVTGMLVVTPLVTPSAAWAHPHEASPAHHGDGQQLANGDNHGPYTTTTDGHGRTCGGDAAVYGLESAHHGPDAGQPGKADGCYETDSMPPGSDDPNPAVD